VTRFAALLASALVACALVTCALVACAPPPASCPTLPADPTAAPLLWRVERSGGAAIWLYGTVHDTGADDVPAAVWHRLDAAPVFVSELGDDEPDPQAMNALARLPWGQVLDRLLPADDWWDLVEAMLGAMTEDELRHARPWFALVRLHTRMARPPRPAMDAALAERARSRGIAVEPLESWQDQLAALDASVTPADLSRAIHGRAAVPCQTAQLRAAYRASDLVALERILVEPIRGDRLLAERNRRWLPKIEDLLAKAGGFVAVGLGHLLGTAGLIAQLERAGYRVTRER
jgi:uncharacterized protein YbaP (TraB family)